MVLGKKWHTFEIVDTLSHLELPRQKGGMGHVFPSIRK
jgi:hypothetical protein